MLLKTSMLFGSTTIIKGALSFITIAIFTRLLNADQYGDYAIVIALVSFIDVFGFMWIRQVLMRHVLDEPTKEENHYVTNSILLYVPLSLVCVLGSLIVLASEIFASHETRIVFGLIGFIAVSEATSCVVILMARLKLRLRAFFILSVLKPTLALLIGVFLINAGYGVLGAVLGVLTAYLIITFSGGLFIAEIRNVRRKYINHDTIRAIMAYGLPMIATLAMQSAIQSTDRVLLETLIGGNVTGFYAAAQDIPLKLMTILISAIHLSAYPLAIKAYETQGEEAAKKQLMMNCVFSAGIIFPAAVAISLLAPQLTHIFLGEEFRPFANQYFPIFAAITVMNCATQYYFALSFHISKRTNLMIIPFIIALAINAIIGYVLIPTMAEQGAIWGSCLSYGFLLIASILIGNRIFALPVPVIELTKVVAAVAMMAGFLWWLNLEIGIVQLAIYTITGGTLYLAMILLLNPLNARQYAKNLVKSRA